jgi:structure-specific endonuclease subunit SLX1
MGHVDCWSRHALKDDEENNILPDMLQCPSCGGGIRWGDMMKELSLRVRGGAEIEKLLKSKRTKYAEKTQ